jgi:prevent-host-death family protein
MTDHVTIHVPETRPIGDLARHAGRLVERARERQQPIVITSRGQEVAALVPIDLYRRMASQYPRRIVSPRLANPADAAHFRVDMTTIELTDEQRDEATEARPDKQSSEGTHQR